jgi:hypothetical protein
MEPFMKNVTLFFEECQVFFEKRIELLKKAKGQTRELSRWIAEIGYSNITSALSKIKNKYTPLSEKERNEKMSKHLERAAFFLKEIHFNDAIVSTLISNETHNEQKKGSEALLKKCEILLKEYETLAPDYISKVKSWLSAPLRWLNLLPVLRAIAIKWQDPQKEAILSLIKKKGSEIERSETNPPALTAITKNHSDLYSPLYEKVKECLSKIKSEDINPEDINKYVEAVCSSAHRP